MQQHSIHTIPQPAVICTGITKSFGEDDSKVMALRGVDLTIDSGEVIMLVGPSGCGKTTLISVMAGILKGDSGTCKVLGQDLSKLSSDEITEFRGRNIGFIFQSYNLLPPLSLVENVSIPLIINGVPREEANRRAREILTQVGLGKRLESRPGSLSGGQQQRVAIARAMVHQPKLLVCDEPTSALDHVTGMHIMELLRQAAKERNTTLVIITHDNRILGYADRIAHMDDGRVIDTPHTLAEETTHQEKAL